MLTKTADPTVVGEPGDIVNFTFVVDNLSDTSSVTIDTLVDSVFGDLNGQGTCSVPQSIAPLGSYACATPQLVSGAAGDVHVNTAEAAGTDDFTGLPVSDDDMAQVQIIDTDILGCLHCPAKVTFRKSLDRFSMQGLLPLPLDFDPSLSGFEVTLSNADGVVFNGELLVGDLERKGRNFQFKDKGAKKGAGIRGGVFRVQFRPFHGEWKVEIQGYEDLSAADEPTMTLSVVVGGVLFQSTNDWDERKNGWQLKRIPLT